MKNIFFTIIVLPFLLTLSSCDKNVDKKSNSDKLQVYASIYPIYDFAKKIGGGKIEVYNITSAGAEPHDFEITSKDMANLSKSDLFIYNGGEHWVDTVKEALKNIKYLNASSGIKDRINYRIKDKINEENLDAHFWLSPINAKIQMENIKNGLIEIDSNNKEYYESNYNIYCGLLDDLDKKIKNSLADIKNRNLILTHPAFGYFCKEYNLNQIAIARDEADPKAMADIITFIKNNNVKAIFYEEFSSSKLVDSIIKETKIKALTLNPVESLSEYDIKAGEDYFSIMEKNIIALTNGLN